MPPPQQGIGLAKKPLDQFEDASDVEEEDGLDPDEDIEDDDLDDEDIEDDDDLDDDEDGLDDEDIDGDDVDEEDEDDDEDDEGDQKTVTLDALEAEELDTVETNDPATILVDEASEIKALRRVEMAIDVEADTRRVDEFVCTSCFLLRKNVQLADPENMLCADCT